MRANAWFGIALLLCCSSALACVNAIGTDHDGRRFQAGWEVGHDLVASINTSATRDHWLGRASAVVANARSKPDLATLTELGIVLMYQGRHASAIRLFLAIERRYPGHPETAANLGTALELAGHDAVALRWIRLGIRRNADEHWGTEWLHARILEAKIAAARDPTYLERHSVAGLAFEKTLVPSLPRSLPRGNTGVPVRPWDLHVALGYQLQERTGFVKPRDAVVANLLHDWATLNLAAGPIENADVLYDLAVTYGAPRDALMRNRQAYIARVLAQAGDAEAAHDAACVLCPQRD